MRKFERLKQKSDNEYIVDCIYIFYLHCWLYLHTFTYGVWVKILVAVLWMDWKDKEIREFKTIMSKLLVWNKKDLLKRFRVGERRLTQETF